VRATNGLYSIYACTGQVVSFAITDLPLDSILCMHVPVKLFLFVITDLPLYFFEMDLSF
jgi:hypothetical protein